MGNSSAASGEAGVRLWLGSRLGLWLLPGVFLLATRPADQRWLWALLYDSLVLLAYVIDARGLSRLDIVCRRRGPGVARVGEVAHYELELSLLGAQNAWVNIADTAPRSVRLQNGTVRGRLSADSAWHVTRQLLGTDPGTVRIGPAFAQVESRLGLARRRLPLSGAHTIVFVPIAPSARPALRRAPRAAQDGRPQHALRAARGISALRNARNTNTDSLRKYAPGDARSQIDFKATAKRGTPIVRQRGPDPSEPVLLVLDASRAMAQRDAPDADTRFGRAITAALAHAHETLERGGSVGVLCFHARPAAEQRPARGSAQRARILRLLADVRPARDAFDVQALLAHLARTAPQRARIVLFTDLASEQHAAGLIALGRVLQKRHDVRCVDLEDAEREQALRRPLTEEADLFAQAAAIDLTAERLALRRRVAASGMVVTTDIPEGLHKPQRGRYGTPTSTTHL